MVKNLFNLVVGAIQIAAGLIIVGLTAKNFHDVRSNSIFEDVDKVDAFGPVLIGLLVISSGIIGILSGVCSSGKVNIFYLMSAVVAASASAGLLWNNGVAFSKRHCDLAYILRALTCSDEAKQTLIATMAFASMANAASVLGMVATAVVACRKS